MRQYPSLPMVGVALLVASMTAYADGEPASEASAVAQRAIEDSMIAAPSAKAGATVPTATRYAVRATRASVSAKSKPRHHASKPQIGKASYYAKRFNGRRTASGHLYYQDAYTAAHRTLPLGTWVKVTNLRNQRSVVVQITDRGPFAGASRIIDLSKRSANELDMEDAGVVTVRLEVVQEYVKSASADDVRRLDVASL